MYRLVYVVCCVAEADPYKKTLEMLEALGFPELLPNFQQHMLMVRLCCESMHQAYARLLVHGWYFNDIH